MKNAAKEETKSDSKMQLSIKAAATFKKSESLPTVQELFRHSPNPNLRNPVGQRSCWLHSIESVFKRMLLLERELCNMIQPGFSKLQLREWISLGNAMFQLCLLLRQVFPLKYG